MANGTGWQSKDIITWMILIWGFYRLANPPNVMAGGPACTVPGMTQAGLQNPPWVTATGERFTTETP